MPRRARWAVGLGLLFVALATVAILVVVQRGARRSPPHLRADAGEAGDRATLLGDLRRSAGEPQGRVLLLGLDGLDWDFVLPLVDAGHMPNLAHLLERGSWGRLQSISPMLSPLIWTTIATGVSPEVHGILDFVEHESGTGKLIPVTSGSREVPALWNIASALGRRVDVVGWWGTWPAEEIHGTMVTDRLYYTLTEHGQEAESRRDMAGVVSPAERTTTFAELRRRAVRETGWEELHAFMDVSRQTFDRSVAAARGLADPVDGFRRILASSRTYLESGLVLAGEEPDLLMVYLEGTDTIGHLLAGYMPPPIVPDVAEQQAAVYAAAVPHYFAHVDEWIGRYLESCPLEEWTWVVVSDHGFKWGADRPRGLSEAAGLTAATGATAPLWHSEDGVFVIAGRGIPARGRAPDSRSVYDVTPTVSALIGLPPGSDWRGSPLPGVGRPALAAVDYATLLLREDVASASAVDSAASAEALARLEALGYLGGGTEGEDAEVSAASSDLTRSELNNLGLLQIDEGRLADAEATFRRAIELYPDHPYTYVNLNLALLEQRRYDEADRELWKAVKNWAAVGEGWREPSALIAAVARSYLERDLAPRATALLQRGVRERPRDLALWLEL
ncbi:MAG: alkaline phosphatase family protein, partial [Thermoanaerobaculia bacterium]